MFTRPVCLAAACGWSPGCTDAQWSAPGKAWRISGTCYHQKPDSSEEMPCWVIWQKEMQILPSAAGRRGEDSLWTYFLYASLKQCACVCVCHVCHSLQNTDNLVLNLIRFWNELNCIYGQSATSLVRLGFITQHVLNCCHRDGLQRRTPNTDPNVSPAALTVACVFKVSLFLESERDEKNQRPSFNHRHASSCSLQRHVASVSRDVVRAVGANKAAGVERQNAAGFCSLTRVFRAGVSGSGETCWGGRNASHRLALRRAGKRKQKKQLNNEKPYAAVQVNVPLNIKQPNEIALSLSTCVSLNESIYVCITEWEYLRVYHWMRVPTCFRSWMSEFG